VLASVERQEMLAGGQFEFVTSELEECPPNVATAYRAAIMFVIVRRNVAGSRLFVALIVNISKVNGFPSRQGFIKQKVQTSKTTKMQTMQQVINNDGLILFTCVRNFLLLRKHN
jgi:hypothetical protein